MTKYNHTNESLKPHQQANTAGSDANLTAIKRQDSRQVNCGGNDSCNWCEIDPDCPHHAGDGENSDTSMEVNVSFGINFLDWMVIILLVVFLVNSCCQSCQRLSSKRREYHDIQTNQIHNRI